MHSALALRAPTNGALAQILAYAVESSGKPRHQISREVGIHRETLLRISRGDRAITLDEAVNVLGASGAFPRASLILAFAGQEQLACAWMRSEMGEFLDAFVAALPGHLERTLGHRVEDVRPRWGSGTAQLVARMLAKHIDDFATRDIAMALAR